jgi:hypothetical protein
MPGPMSGKMRFLADYGQESSSERWQRMEDERIANEQRKKEANTKNLWSMIGTLIALPLGPVAPLIGATVGNIAKAGVVDESLDVLDPTALGTWNRSSDAAYIQDINEQFAEYDTGEFWTGMKDIGTAALFSLQAGGGLDQFGMPTAESIGDWSPTKWGGKETGHTTGQLWDKFFNRPQVETTYLTGKGGY